MKKTKLENYNNEQVSNAVEAMFTSYGIDFIAEAVNDLAFYATNPQASKEANERTLIDLLGNSMVILKHLAEISECSNSRYIHSIREGN